MKRAPACGLFPYDFPSKYLFSLLIYEMRESDCEYLILLYLIGMIISGEEKRAWSFTVH
jgi:hypothetical protein